MSSRNGCSITLMKTNSFSIRNTLEKNSLLVHNMAEDPDLLNFFKLVNQDMASRMVGELFTGFLDEKATPEKSGKTPNRWTSNS